MQAHQSFADWRSSVQRRLRSLPRFWRCRRTEIRRCWCLGPRIAQGYDTVVKHAIEGLRGMPAKGGNPDLDNIEVARAVVHMANAGGAKFKEPEVKAAAAADASAK